MEDGEAPKMNGSSMKDYEDGNLLRPYMIQFC